MKVQIDHAKSWHAIHRGICVSLLDQYLDPDHPGTTFPTLKASKEPPNHDQDHDPVLFFFFFLVVVIPTATVDFKGVKVHSAHL